MERPHDLTGIEHRQANLIHNTTLPELVTPTEQLVDEIIASGADLDEVTLAILRDDYPVPTTVGKRLLLSQLAMTARAPATLVTSWETAGTPDAQRKAQEQGLLREVHQLAGLVVRAKTTVEQLGNNVWTADDPELWATLHQGVFGTADLHQVREQFPVEQIRAFQLGFLRFLQQHEVVKAERPAAFEDSAAFVRKCFAEKIGGRQFTAPPKIEATSLAFVLYLHKDDYEAVHANDNSVGGFVPRLSSYPQLSHRLIIINTGENSPQTTSLNRDRSETRLHELQHVMYATFFQEFDLEHSTRPEARTDDGNAVDILDLSNNAVTSAFMRSYFLEHEKNEAISYNYSPYQMNEEQAGDELYRSLVENVQKGAARAGADPARQAELADIWQRDYDRYVEEKSLLKGAVNLLYGEGQQAGFSSPHIEALLQITPVLKVIRVIQAVLKIRTRADLEAAIANYKPPAVRQLEDQIQREAEESRQIMEIMIRLRDADDFEAELRRLKDDHKTQGEQERQE